jgi:hypothetical protein
MNDKLKTILKEAVVIYSKLLSRNLPIYISLFPVAPTLEHRASMKRFVSLQFLNSKRVGRTSWMGVSPLQGRYLYKHRINTDKHPCLQWDSSPRFQRSSGRGHSMP